MKRKLTHEAWLAEARERFGSDPNDWAFCCPNCRHVATIRDWRAAGATDGEIAFSCVGRRTGATAELGAKHGPCNYAGGGLFRLNPVEVECTDGTVMEVFEFASATGTCKESAC